VRTRPSSTEICGLIWDVSATSVPLKSGREETISALMRAGMDVIALDVEQGKYGAVETHEEAKRCAALFRAHSDRLDGIIGPNFGDERAETNAMRLSRLRFPCSSRRRLTLLPR